MNPQNLAHYMATHTQHSSRFSCNPLSVALLVVRQDAGQAKWDGWKRPVRGPRHLGTFLGPIGYGHAGCSVLSATLRNPFCFWDPRTVFVSIYLTQCRICQWGLLPSIGQLAKVARSLITGSSCSSVQGVPNMTRAYPSETNKLGHPRPTPTSFDSSSSQRLVNRGQYDGTTSEG